MKAKILFKFIAVCLIQTIVLADVCLAQTVFVNFSEFKTEYLAAKLVIDISLFEQAFDESYASALSADEPKNFDNVIFSITKENIKAIQTSDTFDLKLGVLEHMHNDLLMNPQLKLTKKQFKVLIDIVWAMDNRENDKHRVLIVLSLAIVRNHDLLPLAVEELAKSNSMDKFSDFFTIILGAVKLDNSIKFSLIDFRLLIKSLRLAKGAVLKSVAADCINYAIRKDGSLAQELIFELANVPDDLSISALTLALLDALSQNQEILITQQMLNKLLDYTLEVNKQPELKRFLLITAKTVESGQNLIIDQQRVIKLIDKIETLSITKDNVAAFSVLLSEMLINDISLFNLFLKTPINSKTKKMLAIAVSLASEKRPDIFTREMLLNLFKQSSLDPFLLEFKPEGSSVAASSYIAQALLNISSDTALESPKDFPALRKKVKALEIAKHDLPFDFEQADAVYILGRTVIVVSQGEYYTLKLLKKNESNGLLEYEHRVMEWVDEKKDKLKLECEYAKPVFIKGQRVLRINSGNIPADIRQELETAAKKDGKFRVSKGNGAYTFICYKVKDNNAFTYLNDKLISDTDFIDSSKRFLHDLAVFSKIGIMNTSLIELFHSLENQRRYLWMIDVLSPIQGVIFDRLGAGVVRGFSRTSEYPNSRIRFMADLAEFRTIERIISIEGIGDRVIQNNQKKVLASYLGDYLLSWVFIYVSRLKKQGKLTRESFNDQDFINYVANDVKEVFLYFLNNFFDDKAKVEEIAAMINWKRLAAQIVFYPGGAYKEYFSKAKIPRSVHGKHTKVIIKKRGSNYFDGWGYFDVSLLNKKLPSSIKNHIIKTYLTWITNKTEISTVYKIVQDNDLADKIAADAMIPENYKPRLISLLGEYQQGFRYDGINEDLGPFNGPNPLTELIKALYVLSGFIVNEQGEQIQKSNNLKADKLNSNPRAIDFAAQEDKENQQDFLPKVKLEQLNQDQSFMIVDMLDAVFKAEKIKLLENAMDLDPEYAYLVDLNNKIKIIFIGRDPDAVYNIIEVLRPDTYYVAIVDDEHLIGYGLVDYGIMPEEKDIVISFRLFEEYRHQEKNLSAQIFKTILSGVREIFGNKVTGFMVSDNQINNRHGITSAAVLFYLKMGFKFIDRDLHSLWENKYLPQIQQGVILDETAVRELSKGALFLDLNAVNNSVDYAYPIVTLSLENEDVSFFTDLPIVQSI